MVSKQVYRRRRILALVAIGALVWGVASGVSQLFSWTSIASVNHELVASYSLVMASDQISLPSVGSAAIGIGSSQVLASSGTPKAVPIASITKVITALVVLEKMPLKNAEDPGPTLTFNTTDIEILKETQAQGAATQQVSLGQQMSERDAIAVMLLASAGNYATSLAINAYGDMNTYLARANSWLASKGLSDTHVEDASGMSPKSRGTTKDMITLASLAEGNPAIASIVSSPSVDVKGLGRISNGNPMLNKDAVNGIKSGSTYEADECLLYSVPFVVDGVNRWIFGISLGMPDFQYLISNAEKSIDSIKNNLSNHVIVPKNKDFGWVQLSQESIKIVSEAEISLLLVPGQKVEVVPQIDDHLEVKIGAVVGKVTVSDGVSTKSVNLILQK